ncbi:MAG TPA: 3-deoxy-7-phosphoheptulonate synthase [Anaerolineae bacterium]|nr:3-deoxy-7-phosphoheptulonate synthase [Anaerolineae bacterium]
MTLSPANGVFTVTAPKQTNQIPLGRPHQPIIGGADVVMMAGPCSVESYEQTRIIARELARQGVTVLRGGAFKPRTSPHSFQGLGQEGLEILRAVADEFDMLVITEALAVDHIDLVAQYADIIQLGSRNMQHYPLLWAAGELRQPVMLKRGFMSTIDEWLKATEHIHSRGNDQIMLCERGIRTFETATRNTLDTNGIALVKQTTGFPVIGDPSHGTGRADLVVRAALASVAAGADGLLVECHHAPAEALSDADQALPLSEMADLMRRASAVAEAVGRGFR